MRYRRLDERVEESCNQTSTAPCQPQMEPCPPGSGWSLVALALAMAMATPAILVGQSANVDEPQVALLQVESPEQRLRYLATAQIWEDPGELTPAALLAGPPLEDGSGLEGALDGRPFPCTFAEPGKTMGGNTPKFLCTTTTGKTIRLKYTDGSKDGNREVFAAVAASRLLWALGFKSDPIYPISIDCRDCPKDPMSGKGPKAQRSYLAIYQPQFTELVMVDRSEQNQGWRWAELDRAIDSLPVGEVRSRQRQHFDALMLAGVILQHGDRKPEQQRLACRGTLNLEAGEIRPLGWTTTKRTAPLCFLSVPVPRPATRRCRRAGHGSDIRRRGADDQCNDRKDEPQFLGGPAGVPFRVKGRTRRGVGMPWPAHGVNGCGRGESWEPTHRRSRSPVPAGSTAAPDRRSSASDFHRGSCRADDRRP